MRCNLCDGSGMRHSPDGLLPCPECGGCGVAHCCDGLVACGEIEGDIRYDRTKAQDYAAQTGAAFQGSTNETRDQNEAAGFKP